MNGPGAGRLLIFDLDGTLFRGDRVSVAAAWHVCDLLRIERPPAETVCSWFGKPIHEFRAWFQSLAPGREIEAELGEYDRRELELVPSEGRLFPGVVEALEELAGDDREMAICTNGRDPYVSTVLESMGIARFFGVVRLREIEAENKTSMVADILSRRSVRPAAAAVIGDRRDDVEAAKGNGLYSVGAGYGFGATGELSGADTIVASAAEIPGAVRRLFEGG